MLIIHASANTFSAYKDFTIQNDEFQQHIMYFNKYYRYLAEYKLRQTQSERILIDG